jgi:hypothetical protein
MRVERVVNRTLFSSQLPQRWSLRAPNPIRIRIGGGKEIVDLVLCTKHVGAKLVFVLGHLAIDLT